MGKMCNTRSYTTFFQNGLKCVKVNLVIIDTLLITLFQNG